MSKASKLLMHNLTVAQDLFSELGALAADLQDATDLIADALLGDRKLMSCGNGGSACDSAHFTAEIAGRYKLERPGFPAIDLTADHSVITALINDYPPDQLFARLVQAHGQRGDVLAVFSTSGNSNNVKMALEVAPAKDIKTIAFLGRDGGRCKGLADVELIVPSDITARIQEAHMLMYHTVCELLDPLLAGQADPDDKRSA
jgi:D-sedoheptulose 7-phosphate isomerase